MKTPNSFFSQFNIVKQIPVFAKLNWLTKPLRAFDNQTPIQILESGSTEDIEDLIVEARAVGVAQ